MNLLKNKKQTIIIGLVALIVIFSILFFTRTYLKIDRDEPLKILAVADGTVKDYDVGPDSQAFENIKAIVEEDFYLPSAKVISSGDLDSLILYFKSEGVSNELKIISDGRIYLNQEHIQFKFSTNDEEIYKSIKEIVENI